MKISPVNMNYHKSAPSVQFQGKHSCMKWGATIFGTVAALGAIGGTIIMSGGVATIPWIAAYTGLGAGSGAIIGHSIDKGARDFDKKA